MAVLARKAAGRPSSTSVTYRFSGHSPIRRLRLPRRARRSRSGQAGSHPGVFAAGCSQAKACHGSRARGHRRARRRRGMVLSACRPRSTSQVSPRARRGPAIAARHVLAPARRPRAPGPAAGDVLEPLEENSRVQRHREEEPLRHRPATGEPLPEGKAITFRDALFEAMLAPLLRGPAPDRLRRGEPRLGRGLRRLPRADRVPALPPPLQLPHLGGGHRRHRGRLRPGGRPRPGRADVLRLHGPRRRRDLQPDRQVAVHVGGRPAHAGGPARRVGSKYGAQHSQDWSSLVAHIPGLKVVFPATPYDAKGMHGRCAGHRPGGLLREPEGLRRHRVVPAGGARPATTGAHRRARREAGRERTSRSSPIGSTLYRAIEAADKLEKEHGLSAEVIDARSLVPFDYEPVIESVRKTGRILLASRCVRARELSPRRSRPTSRSWHSTISMPRPRSSAAGTGSRPPPSWRTCSSRGRVTILDAIHAHVLPLEGYRPEERRVGRLEAPRSPRGGHGECRPGSPSTRSPFERRAEGVSEKRSGATERRKAVLDAVRQFLSGAPGGKSAPGRYWFEEDPPASIASFVEDLDGAAPGLARQRSTRSSRPSQGGEESRARAGPQRRDARLDRSRARSP